MCEWCIGAGACRKSDHPPPPRYAARRPRPRTYQCFGVRGVGDAQAGLSLRRQRPHITQRTHAQDGAAAAGCTRGCRCLCRRRAQRLAFSKQTLAWAKSSHSSQWVYEQQWSAVNVMHNTCTHTRRAHRHESKPNAAQDNASAPCGLGMPACASICRTRQLSLHAHALRA